MMHSVYLITNADGYRAVVLDDRARAEAMAAANHGRAERMLSPDEVDALLEQMRRDMTETL